MYDITNDFKTAIKGNSRQIKARIVNGDDTISQADDLQSIEITSEGGLCRTVMRQAKGVYFGTHTMLGNTVFLEMGVVLPDTSVEYINYGGFKVTEVTEDIGGKIYTAKMYDRMYEALQPYALTPTYPITVLQLLQAICTELGWTLATTTFANSSISLTAELFTESQMTYRDILNMIAEASGTIMFFNKDDELELKTISASVLETLNPSELLNLKLEPIYGELNSLVLSRQPQEDNVVEKDDESIAIYGLNEFKIVNNYILDSDRATYITPIFTVLNGIKYYPFKADTIGLGYYEVGDRIKVKDLGANEYEVLVMNISLKISGGLSEVLECKIPEKTSTNYDYAGIIGRTIKQTEIKVDKQQGEIAILSEEVGNALVVPRQPEPPESPDTNDLWLDTDDNIIYIYDGATWQPTSISPDTLDGYYTKEQTEAEISLTADEINLSVASTQETASTAQALAEENSTDIESVQSNITALQIEVDGLDVKVEGIGGTNLLKNSSGLKGSIEEWQEFDENGDLLDADNDGTVVQTTDTEENTESGAGIQIDEQFIVQTIPTIIGGSYTFYCRFKKLNDLDLTISGVAEMIPITAGEYVDETWAVFKTTFIATDSTTTIKISNTASGVGSSGLLADMVCKLGEVNGWVQAPNEVYGRNFKFDKDGFSVTSLTDEFKAVLDNIKLGIYDTSSGVDKIMALFSKDAGLITKLVAQDEFVLQRYQNSAKAVRFIPTATGCMITVNN